MDNTKNGESLVNLLISAHGTTVLDFLDCRALSALELTCKRLNGLQPTTNIERCRRKCIFRQFHQYLIQKTFFNLHKKRKVFNILQKYYRPRFKTNCPKRRKTVNVADIEELVDHLIPLFDDVKELRKFLGVAHCMTSRCVKEAFLRKFLKRDPAERESIKTCLWEDLIFRKADIGTVNYLLRREDECDRICCVRALSQIMSAQSCLVRTEERLAKIYDYNIDAEIIKQMKGCSSATYNFYTDTCFQFFRDLYCRQQRKDFIESFFVDISPLIMQFKTLWATVPSCADTQRFTQTIFTLKSYSETKLAGYQKVLHAWSTVLESFSKWLEKTESHKYHLLFYANYVIFNTQRDADICLDCTVFSIHLLKHFDCARYKCLRNLSEKETLDVLCSYYEELKLYKDFSLQWNTWKFRETEQRPWVYECLEHLSDKSDARMTIA
mmetsp:Transcript_5127/g.6471  ORF Transcript_5127/g.6471 Transcript_5127/m.6471 type:complete len:439 (-) Transcript_5127:1239-2555(-)